MQIENEHVSYYMYNDNYIGIGCYTHIQLGYYVLARTRGFDKAEYHLTVQATHPLITQSLLYKLIVSIYHIQ